MFGPNFTNNFQISEFPSSSDGSASEARRRFYRPTRIVQVQKYQIHLYSKVAYHTKISVRSRLYTDYTIRVHSEVSTPQLITDMADIGIESETEKIEVKNKVDPIDVGTSNEDQA